MNNTVKPVTIVVTPSESGKSVRFYCKACRRWHVHGHPFDGDPGSRESHCTNPASPQYRRAVILVLAEEE